MSSDITYTDPRLVAAFRRFATVAALITAAVGALALAAWAVGLGPATALIPGQPPLPPLTALGLLLAGAALWLLAPPAAASAPPPSLLRRRLGLICAGVAVALGLLVLLEYMLNMDLGLDRALFSQALLAVPAAHPGRPGLAAAANLLLCGLALLALDPALARRLSRWVSAAVLLLALVLSGLVLLSFTFETTTASPLAAHLPIEPSSALAGVLLALGVLAATPGSPLTTTLTSTLAGGAITRRLLPVAILLPFITGWLRLVALQHGVIDLGLGSALTVAGNVLAYGGVTYWTARHMNRADARRAAAHQALLASEERLQADVAERQRTEAALRQSEERFAKAFYASPAGVTFIRRSDGRYVDVNDRFLEMLQFQRDEVIGHTTLELDLYPDPAVRADLVARISAAGGVRNVELDLRAKTGELRSVLYSGEQIQLDGEPHTLGIVIDDTEHRRADEALRELNAQLEARVADRTAELAASEAQLRALFNVLPVGVSILDAQRRVRQFNPALGRIMRLTAEELAGGVYSRRPVLRPDGSRMPADEIASVVAAREQRPVLDAEMGVVLENGQTIWLVVNAAPLPNGEVVVITADITERKQAEAALRESEQKFSKAFHSSAAGMVIAGTDYRLLEVNDVLLSLIGYTRADVIGRTPQELGMLTEADGERVRQALARDGRLSEMELALHGPGGQVKTTLTSVEAIRLASGPGWLGLHYDITERKRTEAALMAGEQRNRELFEAERRQAQELTLRDLMHTALARELPVPEILRIVVDGIAHTLGYTQVSLYLLEGELLRLQHQVGYDQVIESVHISSGVSGRVVRTRQPVLVADVRADPDFLGAIDGIHSEICVPLFEQGRVAGVLNLESTQGVGLTESDLRLIVALGEQVDFALGRARLTAQARESQQRFASAFNNAPIGITLVSPDGHFLQVNPALCRMVGYTQTELLATTFQALTHPDDLETDLQLLGEVLAGLRQSYQMEKRYFHKQGHIVWILLSVSLVRDPDGLPLYFISQIEDISERKAVEARLAAQAQVLAQERDLMQALMDSIPDTIYFKDTASRFTRINRAQAEFLHLPTPEAAVGKTDLDFHEPALAREIFDEEQNQVLRGHPLVNRIDLVTGPDGQPRWMSSTKVSLRDADGQVTGLVGISRDITAVKQAEARLLSSLQEKEVLLKEIHHRVKNNLQVVSSLLRLQAENLSDPELRDAFEDSQRRVRSMALVHEQLYRSTDLAHIDFAEYLTGLVNYLRRSHTRPLHTLRLRVEVAHITLEIDRAIPLGLLVNELVTNSLKYAFPAAPPDSEIWVTAARDPAGALVLTVGDNGVGLPETVDVEQTASMGWQLVQSFVAQVHGRYTLQRQPGTVFTLTIPERPAPTGF